MKRRFWAGFFTGILAAIVIGASIVFIFIEHKEKQMAARLKAPALPEHLREEYNFKYTTLDGTVKHTSELKGKVIFVNFWGTWCLPCVAEMPRIQTLYDSFKNDTSVAFIIASRLDDADKIRSFAKKHNYTLPFYIINDDDIPASMKFNQYPATFIYAKDGSIAMKHINASDWADPSVISFLRKLEQQL